MITAEKVIKEIYRLPLEEREKIAFHIMTFGIRTAGGNVLETLNLDDWQKELAEKPFSLKEASEYMGVSTVTLRRWLKSGKLWGYKIGRAYSFDVLDLKKFKKSFLTGGTQ
jgi:excisionase family DNA binding protein